MNNYLIALLFLLFPGGEKFLNEIDLYQQESYFKQKVYQEHDYKSFAGLKEVKEIVNPDNYDFHLLNAAVFFATNKLRDEKKLKQLKYSANLRDAAAVHAYQMVDKKFFDHFNSRNLKLRSPEDRIKLFGITASADGENLDYTFVKMPSQTTYLQLGEQLVDDWFHSPPHKKNMLSKNFSNLGCAAYFEAKNKDGFRYVKATQDFSTP